MSDLIVAQSSFQAIRGADVLCRCWLRSEIGPVNAEVLTLEVAATAYGKRITQATWPATGEADGRVTFIVPEDHKLTPGLYQLRLRVTGGGDEIPDAPVIGSLCALGLLEIAG